MTYDPAIVSEIIHDRNVLQDQDDIYTIQPIRWEPVKFLPDNKTR
jgi:hypothetical protein